MATLPPRKNLTPTRSTKQQYLSPLQTLQNLGFSKSRAEKALASTGNRGIQLASDWLLAHVNDQTLDESAPREYILYACPTGAFQQQLEDFWIKSKAQCGWNGAHNYVPHITLVSFFKAPDENALHLSKSLKQVVDMCGASLDRPLKLELYTSQNFLGFFVAEDDANYLKRLALSYMKEVSNSTISLEPHVKSLHLTLAYQFPQAQFNVLKNLVDNLEPGCASSWELRLYSRDTRLATKQVHKVMYAHTPLEVDELELRIGDFVYLNSDMVDSSSDGWTEGISWLTGQNGFLPVNYTERTAESDAWTLHKVVHLSKISPSCTSGEEAGADVVDGVSGSKSLLYHEKSSLITEETESISNPSNRCLRSEIVVEEGEISTPCEGELNPPLVQSEIDSISAADEESCNNLSKKRRIYIMRHGERIDFTFGTWIPYCFDEFNLYHRKDLNMPKALPNRQNCPDGWQSDSPLTNIGLHQAFLTGEAMKDAKIKIHHVFCSPSYRCVQTCTSALEGMNLKDKMEINIEPGFFEWLAWYPDSLPNWLSTSELKEAKYKVNQNYRPFVTENHLKDCLKETAEEFYTRNSNVLNEIIQTTTGNVLIVAHAATLDTCTRQLVGEPPRSSYELGKIIHKIPYCSLVNIEESESHTGENSEDNKSNWTLIEPICPSVTHNKNIRFDWNVLLTK